jgi:diacylglycerol kinase
MVEYHKQKRLSFLNIIKSFQNAFRGFSLLFKYEYNLYIQLIIALIVIIAGFIYKISLTEWAIQTTAIGLVIFSELVNTSIEKTMDFINPDYHEKVRDIEDLSAGAVLFTVIISVAVAVFIYLPKIF